MFGRRVAAFVSAIHVGYLRLPRCIVILLRRSCGAEGLSDITTRWDEISGLLSHPSELLCGMAKFDNFRFADKPPRIVGFFSDVLRDYNYAHAWPPPLARH
jgi:hypothetical protein